jgi:uncharacterized protein YndB with AHSA1/START domain
MKVIRIILIIVTLIALVFFATGLVVKEVNYSVEVDIDKPIEEVFTFFTAPETLKKWMPEVKSLEPINLKEGKVGSTYKMVIETQGQEMIMTEKILAYISNKKITFRFDSDEMIKIDDFIFIKKGSKTKMIQNCSVNSKSYITACLFPYFKGTFTAASQEYMDRFKMLVE